MDPRRARGPSGGRLSGRRGHRDGGRLVKLHVTPFGRHFADAEAQRLAFRPDGFGQLTETESADIAKVLIELSSQTAAYQSALRAGASIVQSSLLDFLR